MIHASSYSIDIPADAIFDYDRLAAEGNCRTVPASIMFPTNANGVPRAKAVCAGCPVARLCLDLALSTPEPYGVWGGYGESERRRMRQRVRVRAA